LVTHAQLLAYLEKHADTILVVTFSTAMNHVTSRPR
jgi:hypothetical protein